MTTQANNSNKTNSFKISEQVKYILHNNGLSKAFNYADYDYFKNKAKNAFNKAQTIANFFMEEHRNESDLNEYQF